MKRVLLFSLVASATLLPARAIEASRALLAARLAGTDYERHVLALQLG